MPKADPGRLSRLTTTRDKPALSREYRMVLAEIDSLTAKDVGPDVVDQLAARRGAKGSGRAQRSS